MSPFKIIPPLIGMGATSHNVIGNQLPHTIHSVCSSSNTIETTLDDCELISDNGTENMEYNFQTNRTNEIIRWVLKESANPTHSIYFPEEVKSPYQYLKINTKNKYINSNI